VAKGYVAGQPTRFIAGHYRPERATKTYPMKSAPWHPRAKHGGSSRGCVAEHVLVAEKALGRFMPAGAEIHHVDEDITNNANRNLVICESRAYHKLLHARTRIVKAGGNPNTQRICGACSSLKPIDAFNKGQRRCRQCQSRWFKAWSTSKKQEAA
jgi:hypothetical protein